MKYIIAISIGFFLCCKGSSDNESNDQSDELNSSLMSNSQDSLIIKVCDFFEESSEGGEIRGYYNSTGELRRIEVELYGELGKVYKVFKIGVDSDSFVFEQRYLFYNKPLYEVGFNVVDSVLIKGTASKGIIDKRVVTGERMSVENIDRVLLDIYSSKEKYNKFLGGCSPK